MQSIRARLVAAVGNDIVPSEESLAFNPAPLLLRPLDRALTAEKAENRASEIVHNQQASRRRLVGG